MPYLQLDLPGHYPIEAKRRLAHRMSHIFAEIMQTVPSNVTVAFRELGDGNLWRCGGHEPVKAAVIVCDVRRGRPPKQRAHLAEALVSACVEALDLHDVQLSVGFTQHAGDEAYRPGLGLYADWTPAEAHVIAS